MDALLFFQFSVMNVKLMNENNSLIIAVSKLHGPCYSITFFYLACIVVSTHVIFI